MRKKTILRILYFWTLFIGIGALVGTFMMWTDPSGKSWGIDGLLPILQEKMPFSELLFQNFMASGLALLLLNGVTQLTAFLLLVKKVPSSGYSALACGLILMAWTALEWVLFGFIFMSNLFFVFGLLETLTAAAFLKHKPSERKT